MGIVSESNRKMQKFIELLDDYGMGFTLSLTDLKENELTLNFWYLGTNYQHYGVLISANLYKGYHQALNRAMDTALSFFETEKHNLKLKS